MSAPAKLRDSHDAANLAAARIILAAPERYAGLMMKWARMVGGIDANINRGSDQHIAATGDGHPGLPDRQR